MIKKGFVVCYYFGQKKPCTKIFHSFVGKLINNKLWYSMAVEYREIKLDWDYLIVPILFFKGSDLS